MNRLREPATTLTNVALALASLSFAVILVRAGLDVQAVAWAAGFVAAGVGAALGAHAHGFPDFVSRRTHEWVWFGTVLFVGLAGLLFALAALLAIGVDGTLALPATVLAVIVYGRSVAMHRSFSVAGAAYAIALVVLTIAALILGVRPPGAGFWMLLSVALTAGGVAIQRARLALHEHFNHNDLYHVVQLLALYFLFRAATA